MTIGIVGLGYVGLPLAVAFAEAGQRVDRRRHRAWPASTRCAPVSPTSRTSRRSSSQAVASRIEATTRTSRLGLVRRDHHLRPDPADGRTASPTSAR